MFQHWSVDEWDPNKCVESCAHDGTTAYYARLSALASEYDKDTKNWSELSIMKVCVNALVGDKPAETNTQKLERQTRSATSIFATRSSDVATDPASLQPDQATPEDPQVQPASLQPDQGTSEESNNTTSETPASSDESKAEPQSAHSQNLQQFVNNLEDQGLPEDQKISNFKDELFTTIQDKPAELKENNIVSVKSTIPWPVSSVEEVNEVDEENKSAAWDNNKQPDASVLEDLPFSSNLPTKESQGLHQPTTHELIHPSIVIDDPDKDSFNSLFEQEIVINKFGDHWPEFKKDECYKRQGAILMLTLKALKITTDSFNGSPDKAATQIIKTIMSTPLPQERVTMDSLTFRQEEESFQFQDATGAKEIITTDSDKATQLSSQWLDKLHKDKFTTSISNMNKFITTVNDLYNLQQFVVKDWIDRLRIAGAMLYQDFTCSDSSDFYIAFASYLVRRAFVEVLLPKMNSVVIKHLQTTKKAVLQQHVNTWINAYNQNVFPADKINAEDYFKIIAMTNSQKLTRLKIPQPENMADLLTSDLIPTVDALPSRYELDGYFDIAMERNDTSLLTYAKNIKGALETLRAEDEYGQPLATVTTFLNQKSPKTLYITRFKSLIRKMAKKKHKPSNKEIIEASFHQSGMIQGVSPSGNPLDVTESVVYQLFNDDTIGWPKQSINSVTSSKIFNGDTTILMKFGKRIEDILLKSIKMIQISAYQIMCEKTTNYAIARLMNDGAIRRYQNKVVAINDLQTYESLLKKHQTPIQTFKDLEAEASEVNIKELAVRKTQLGDIANDQKNHFDTIVNTVTRLAKFANEIKGSQRFGTTTRQAMKFILEFKDIDTELQKKCYRKDDKETYFSRLFATLMNYVMVVIGRQPFLNSLVQLDSDASVPIGTLSNIVKQYNMIVRGEKNKIKGEDLGRFLKSVRNTSVFPRT